MSSSTEAGGVAPDHPSNPAGRAALIGAVVVVLLGLVQQITGSLFPLLMDALALSATTVGMFFGIAAIVMGLLALVPLILGIVGLTRPGLPKGAAGAGAAIGASTVLSVLVGLLSGPLAAILG